MLTKCIYWQLRDSMSHEESQPKGHLVLNELITCDFLSGELQTAVVLTAEIVTLTESWRAFATTMYTSGSKMHIRII